MANFEFRQCGERVLFTAKADHGPGEGVLVGALFGVCQNKVTAGKKAWLKLGGIWETQKVGTTGSATVEGQIAYWDDAAKLVTPIAAAGLTKIGVFTVATAHDVADTRVLLIPNVG